MPIAFILLLALAPASPHLGATGIVGPTKEAGRLRPVPGSFIVTLRPDADPGPLHGMVRAVGGRVHHEFVMLPGRIVVRDVSPGMEAALARAAGVKELLPDYEVYSALTESVPLLGALATAFEMRNTSGGLAVSVCVLDTGINRFHTMFDDDFNVETPTNRISAWKDFIFGVVTPYDDNGHGSHVAGTIFGRTGLSLGGLPLQGMAPRGRMYIGKMLNSGGTGLFSNLHAGIEWCAGFAPDSPFPPADIINLSLGAGQFHGICDGNDPTGTAAVVNAAASAGSLIVAAAGNEGNSNGVLVPACASGAMSVGATYDTDVGGLIFLECTDPVTAVDRPICFSNRWDFLDVVAPACQTRSASSSGGITLFQLCGTSMASAHVAGLAALVKAANRTMTAAEIRQRILTTALDLGNAGHDRAHGHGRVQAGQAVDVPCFPVETQEQSCGDGFDNDCDGRVDCLDPDCCGGATCAASDTDGDGFGACDCDDTDTSIWAPPGPVGLLSVSHVPGTGETMLEWDPPASAGGLSVVYDVLRNGSPRDFFIAAVCKESDDGIDTQAFDLEAPAPGGIFYYQVGAGNGCPAAAVSVGVDSDGVTRIARSCP